MLENKFEIHCTQRLIILLNANVRNVNTCECFNLLFKCAIGLGKLNLFDEKMYFDLRKLLELKDMSRFAEYEEVCEAEVVKMKEHFIC